MALLYVTDAEGAQADLYHGAVVEDLERDVRAIDALLQVRHQQEISCVEPPVVNGVVIDVAEHGLGPETVGGVVGVDVLAELVHLLAGELLVVLVVFIVHVLSAFEVDAA